MSSTTQPPSHEGDCVICLDDIVEKAKTDACSHIFCFWCIQKWAETKMLCPLCRQPFTFIIHGIVSDTDFKEFHPVAEAEFDDEMSEDSLMAMFLQSADALQEELASERQPENGMRFSNVFSPRIERSPSRDDSERLSSPVLSSGLTMLEAANRGSADTQQLIELFESTIPPPPRFE